MKVKLGDIFEIGSGGTPSKSHPEYYGGDIPWVKTGDLKSEYLYEVEDFITEEGLKNSSAKLYEPDTVLIAMYGATIGATSILKMDACTNQACAAFKKNDKVIPEYLYYFLKSQKVKFVKDGVGGAQPNISAGYLKKVEMELPSLDEQRAIVEVLDKTTNIMVMRNQEIASLDNLIKARFVEMFGDCNNMISMSEICSIITDGTHQPPKFQETGIPFIFVSNLANNTVTYNAEKFISKETYNELYKRTPIEPGDLLLSTVGSYGHPAVVVEDTKFLFQRHIAYLKPKKEIINSFYLHSALLSSDCQRQIEEKVKGIAQKTLNLSEIRKIMIPVPNIEAQNVFVDFIYQVDKSKLKKLR
ncbi:restriction endonuclease subunit S [Blautia sp. AF34-10]|uniref:restriction endonuclease subunit S n=1 Tax=Blautia sp. AF34-10 TaxID=2292968 RepID=UPI000E5CA7DE|nr:restriction endonuclease subunit S [Blautia sp. AF34-10]RHP36929.1 restriction endonuclease subunit S [Blautia sp. AF34-10]